MSSPDVSEGSKGYLRTYALLIRAAELRGLVQYGKVAAIFGLPAQGSHTASVVGEVLGNIVQNEAQFGRPMLSAVAVSQTNNRPGKGFYGMAEDNGLVAPDASENDRRAFWQAELERVYTTWKE